MLVEQGSTEQEPSQADYIFVLPKLLWPKPHGKARWKTSEQEPSQTDYIFVLPKLLWPKPHGKAMWKTRVRNINERMAFAQQGKWKALLDLSMKIPLPTYEPTPEEEILDEHGLSKEMARKLHEDR